jgi:hypothetical protein
LNDQTLRRKAAIVASTLGVAAASFIGIRALSQTDPVGYPSLSTANLTFDGDFDAGCQVLGGEGGWAQKEWDTDYPGTVSIGTHRVQEGKCSGKFQTPAGPNVKSTDNPLSRAEVQAPTMAAASSMTVTREFLYFIPSTSNGGPYYAEIAQMKDNNAKCFNGGMRISRRDQKLYYVTVSSCGTEHEWLLGDTPRDHWFATKVTQTFADNGSVQVWLDQDGTGPLGYTQVLSVPNVDDKASTTSLSLKPRTGLYHREDHYVTTIWGDGFHLIRTG